MWLALTLWACAEVAPEDPTPEVTPVVVDASSFRCITEMTAVRGFYVDNLLGDLAATLAVADAPEGQRWPAGSLVQLVPSEAMVKREAGFSPATDDWEFFFLRPSEDGTEIEARGADEVENAFGGNCASCHAAARETWDWICESDHGCVVLPLSDGAIEGIQEGDPRCGG